MHNHQSVIWKGEKSPLYKIVITKCKFCDKEIKIIKSQFERNKNNFCSYECMGKYISENNIGENHPRWNESLSEEERINRRKYTEYNEFIKYVLKRDNYECKICCEKGNGHNLNVHHLDGYNWCKEKRTDINNGITLCEKCHKEFHKKYRKGNNTKEQFEEFIKD